VQLIVFRLRQHLDIIVSGRFRDVVTRLELGGVKFREVDAR
jgi:hypothetical protein